MQSYLDSPRYRALVAQVLQGNQRPVQSPGEAVANGVGSLADAYMLKKETQKGEARQADYGKAVAGALHNEYDYDQTPSGNTVMARLLGSGNADVRNDFAPKYAEALFNRDQQANAPITPFQQAGIERDKTMDAESARRWQAQQDEQKRQFNVGESDKLITGIDRSTNQLLTHDMSVRQANETERAHKADEAINLKKANDAAGSNAFGRGMEGKAYNLLAMGLKDPSVRASPEYATAWQILSNPKVDPNTGTVIVPDLSQFAPPTSGAPASGAPQQQPMAAPGQTPNAGPVQRMPQIQGFAPPNPSQPEAASAGYANRLEESNKILDDAGVARSMTSLGQRAASNAPFGMGNFIVSSDFQKADQAQRNFINAQLRRESGAVISPEEFANARQQYFPQPGDGEAVLKQKKANRDMAVRNMQLSAGNTLLPPGVIQNASPPKGAPMVPQNQGYGGAPPAADPQAIVDELRKRGVIK